MNAHEMKHALTVAADIESTVGDLYKGFADHAADDKAAQFWRLLSYEEKTHSHMMELIRDHVPETFEMSETELPPPLRNHLEGLLHFRRFVHSLCEETEMAVDPFWQVRMAADLEKSELDTVLHWLMDLKVDPDTRAIIEEMTRGTTDHDERVAEYAKKLADSVPESACP